jgi:hypothetical protein
MNATTTIPIEAPCATARLSVAEYDRAGHEIREQSYGESKEAGSGKDFPSDTSPQHRFTHDRQRSRRSRQAAYWAQHEPPCSVRGSRFSAPPPLALGHI